MALTVVTLALPTPGYEALAQRHSRPLAVSQVFNTQLVVGLDASGNVTPFLTGTVAGIQYALGILDPLVTTNQNILSFTSVANQTMAVLSGVITMQNGMSGNAIVQANVGALVYTADGLTANATNATNPKIGGGTTTGKPVGIFIGFDGASNPKISIIPEDLAISVGASGGLGTALTVAGVQTNTGAKTFNNATLLLENSGGTFHSTLETAATANRVATLPDATCTLAQAAVASGATAPVFTPTAAAITETTGAAGTWSTNVLTQTSGGISAAAHALAGGWVSDGTKAGPILDNTTCTATTGTITVAPAGLPSPLGVPTGTTGLIIIPPPAGAGTVASHTHTQS